jgi:hypothetical protein
MIDPGQARDDAAQMDALRAEIAALAAKREALKQAMEQWYAGSGRGRFPGLAELETVDRELSALDTRFKTLWDKRRGRGGAAA